MRQHFSKTGQIGRTPMTGLHNLHVRKRRTRLPQGRRPWFELLEVRMLLATFTITDTSDSATDTGSLRYAITQSNMTGPGPNVIDFNIPGTGVQTIAPASALPTATVPVTIDGTTQPGYSGKPLIVLDGASAGSSTNGLDLSAANSTIKGLAVDSFGDDGIVLAGTGDTVTGCFVGVDATGTVAAGNGSYGIDCTSGGITIGGTAAGAGNVISGNGSNGIIFKGNGTGDVVQGNFIGTNATGTAALGNNGGNGIVVEGPGGVLIGGTIPGARNIISGNSDGAGVLIYTASDLIEGNYIGTDVTGTVALPNDQGVVLANAGSGVATGSATVGGTVAGAGNVISGNSGGGISILTNSNVIEGNLIGTDASGTVAVPNDYPAISIGGEPGDVGSDNTIGGTVAAARNVISGNNGGVEFGNAGSDNLVEGNYIGTDITGTKAIPNVGDGVDASGSSTGTTIGGTTAGAGNVIAGNTGNGVDVGEPDALVVGNYIGTNASGTEALPNGGDGLYAHNATGGVGSYDTIGGTTAAARNIISGNALCGVTIPGSAATKDLVEGNYIGTDVTGTVALGNGDGGVYILAQSNTIGGTAAGAGNLISANGTAKNEGNDAGITVVGGNFGDGGNSVQGNLIGTDVTGTLNLGNTGDGVHLTDATSGNTIGGSTANAANVIAFNGGDGVNADENSVMNLISQNSIFGNANLGIDLESANGEAGGNTQLPAPVLTSYSAGAGGSVQTGWTLSAAASTTYTIDFYASPVGASGGAPSGQTFLTSIPETTSSSGTASFNESLTLPAGETFVTATATDPTGNTSQFSLQATATGLTSSADPSVAGQSVTFTAVVTNPAIGTPGGTVTFTIDGHAETPVAVSVVNGVDEAVYSSSTLAVGPRTVSAAYSGNDAFAASAPTSALTQTVDSGPAATSTSLSATPNPATFGQNVTFTAIVAPTSGTGTPAGDVTFTIDGQAQPAVALAVESGVDEATFSTSTLATGSHTISVAYGGNASFGPSAQLNPLTETIDAPTTMMLSSSTNPSIEGQSVTFTATVTAPSGAGTPAGSVSFDEGATVLFTSPLDSTGQATFATSTLGLGSDAITAAYTPTGDFLVSPTQTLMQVVNAPPLVTTTTQLMSSANPATFGQTVTITADVSSTTGTPTGDVTFTVDGHAQTPVALAVVNGVDQASISSSALSVGPHTINATYAGNASFTSSSPVNPLSLSVVALTTMRLSSSNNPSVLGQSVTLTATVTAPGGAGTPTGSVSFDEGNTVRQTVDLNSSGQATFTTAALALGSNTITAVFTATGDFSGGSSTPLSQVVNAAPLEATATRVTSSNDASSVGQAVTFTAFVTATGTSTPGGTVTFTIDGKPQPPVTLAVESGLDEASFTTRALTAGSYTFGAIYNGAPSFATSQATPQAQSVSASVTTPPPSTDGPRITLVQRYGYHMLPTSIVLTFDQALEQVTAEDAKDYRIVGPARQTIAVRKAVYDPADLTVTLYPVDRINIHHTYTLIVDGTSPHGLTNTSGQLLDGADRGSADSNYHGLLTWRNLVLDPLPKGWHATKT